MIENKMMTKENIIVAYDGEALVDGTMDVRDLAHSLTGLGEIFEEANFVVNGTRAVTRVNIRSGFQKGSFEISFDVVQSVVTQALNLFGSQPVSGAVNLITLIGVGYACQKGLIQLIKTIKNGAIKSVEKLQENIIKIQYEIDGLIETIEVCEEVYQLYINKKARLALEKLLKPLEKEGIDKFQVRKKTKDNENEIVEEISKNELIYFKLDLKEEDLPEVLSTIYVNVVAPSFEDDNKWRFSTDTEKFFASIKDVDFLQKVDTNEILFGKGDILRVERKTKQVVTPEGKIKNEHEVLKVLEHRSYKQLKLKLSSPEGPKEQQ